MTDEAQWRAATPLRRGEFVTVTIGSWTTTAMVGIASDNGISIAVLFDGAAPLHGGETLALGFLALLRDDDGPPNTFHEIVTHTSVQVTRRA